MNNAGWLKKRLIVILNDNEMSIAPPVGAHVVSICRSFMPAAPFQELKIGSQGLLSMPVARNRFAT